MNIHQNARLTLRGRLLLVERVRGQGLGVAAAATAAGVSARTAYKWLARYRIGGEAALADRRSTPGRSPRRTPAATQAAIERLRRERLSSPRIARRLGLPVSTVGAVLRRLGLGRLKALDERPEPLRYEHRRPGDMIHLDTKKLGKINGIGHRITGDRSSRQRGIGWDYLHVAIDDCSRLAYTELLTAETGEACAGFLARAAAWFAAHGANPRRVMTDNAFAYTNSRALQAIIGKIGARHVTTKPYRPRTNGKAERFIQTALREWLYAKPYRQSNARAADMPTWLHWYNHHRPHYALQAKSPATRLNNVLGNDI